MEYNVGHTIDLSYLNRKPEKKTIEAQFKEAFFWPGTRFKFKGSIIEIYVPA